MNFLLSILSLDLDLSVNGGWKEIYKFYSFFYLIFFNNRISVKEIGVGVAALPRLSAVPCRPHAT